MKDNFRVILAFQYPTSRIRYLKKMLKRACRLSATQKMDLIIDYENHHEILPKMK